MAWVKSFALFFLLQIGFWGGMHFYLTANPKQALIVVDTSFAMKPNFSKASTWIDEFAARTRYTDILVGTDKVEMGSLDELKSKDVLFRTAFGRLSKEKLVNQYANYTHIDRYLLTSEAVALDGWKIINW